MSGKGGSFMNVIPMRPKRARVDKFSVFLGEVDENGKILQTEQVGLAFLKGRAFRLKLWMFSRNVYLVVPDDDLQKTYTIFSIEGFRSSRGEEKSYWNRVGKADLCGNYLRLQIPLFGAELFLSLFPDPVRPASEARSA